MSSPRIFDYPSLNLVVGEWLGRSDLVNAIPDFIRNVEVLCNRDLRTWPQLAIVQAAVPQGTNFLELPGDFEQAYDVKFVGTPYVSMQNFPPNTLDGAIVNDQGTPANFLIPKGFTFAAGYLEFYPPPAANNTLELWYYATIPALDDYLINNWLIARFPDIYLYGALSEAAPYLNNDDRLQTWATRFGSAFASANGSTKKRRSSGSPLNYRPKVVL